VAFLQSHLWWYMTALAVFGVLVGSARMAWEHRAEPGRQVLKDLATYVLISGAGVAAIGLVVSAADDFSSWVIGQSLNGSDFGKNITLLLGLTGASAVSGNVLGPIVVIVLGLVALLASLLQILLMVIRGGMLVILTGILPTAAASAIGGLESGRQWLRKSVAWVVAFALYKPAAAIVYAAAFRLVGQHVFGAGGLVAVLTGLALMMLALVALPALMRFVTPMVAAVASGAAGGGVLAAGAAAAAATLPSGAMRIARGGSDGAGGSSGAGGPAGADGAAGTGSPGASGANGHGLAGAGGQDGGPGASPPASADGAGGQPGAGARAGTGAPAGAGAAPGAGATAAGAAAAAGGAAGVALGSVQSAGAAGRRALESQNGDEGPPGSADGDEGPSGSGGA